ncbi:MAG TPA: glycosyltransferase [Candidatus Polarisedimenticolaceae bacterium]|nr:glycosyltransferase [Candidatus Polarisedimenticolaceae bacterium]
MRILHVVQCYPPTTFATGPPQQVHALSRALREDGVDVRVVTTDYDGPRRLDVPTGRWTEHEGVPVFYGRRFAGTEDLSWQAWRSMRDEARAADLVHTTNAVSWTLFATAAASRRARRPFVISPRGSLDPAALAFSRRKKRVFLALGARRALAHAWVHATSELEAGYVRALVPSARIGIVPNGVVVPDLPSARPGPRGPRTILFLGRIHPKKNVLTLVRAWRAVAPRHPDARLLIAGPDDGGHRAEVVRAIADARLDGSVVLEDAVFGEAKRDLFARAACLVFPSRTENFGNVVAEALSHGLPVVASTGTPWAGLRSHDSGWWVDPTDEALASALDEVLSSPDEVLAARGERGRRWMIEEFRWPAVARRMRDFYLEVVAAGVRS